MYGSTNNWLHIETKIVAPIYQVKNKNSMNRYFAKLDGDIIGIDAYIRFEANDKEEADMIADQQAENNYGQYEDPYDEEDGSPLFYSSVEVYDPEKHDEYFEHINQNTWEVLS